MAETIAIRSMRVQNAAYSTTTSAGSVTACTQEIADPMAVMIPFAG